MKSLSGRLRAVCRMIPVALVAAVSAPSQSGAAPGSLPPGLNASDWGSIRAEYERHRHRAVTTAEGPVMAHPGQQWRTHFDETGFTVRPDNANWTWGLELKSYGFPGSECTALPPAK